MDFNLSTALISVFVPVLVSFVLAWMKHPREKKPKRMSQKNFVVLMPPVLWQSAAILSGMLSVILILISITQGKQHILCYICFGSMIMVSVFIIIAALVFRVDVKGNLINVSSIHKRKYSFTFDDIVYVKRKPTRIDYAYEAMIIKTSSGKRLRVENTFIGYTRFLKRIINDVDPRLLDGFSENRFWEKSIKQNNTGDGSNPLKKSD